MVTSRTYLGQRRRVERGFTLIETLVSVAILSIIGGAVGITFSVGIRALGAGGPGDRSIGAHDFSTLEQQLGQDGARASCIKVTSDATVYGRNANITPNPCNASTGYGKVGACSSAAICFAWPVVSDSSCHVAVYTTTGTAPNYDGIVKRTEYTVLGGTATAGPAIPMTADTVKFQIGSIPPFTAPSNYPWVRALPVTITATNVRSGQFSQPIEIHPVATDPGAAASWITSSGSPC
jgi:prepilin-type N-terminal cleavage/methylation domain-containing protein